jgi:hypothetical protein
VVTQTHKRRERISKGKLVRALATLKNHTSLVRFPPNIFFPKNKPK